MVNRAIHASSTVYCFPGTPVICRDCLHLSCQLFRLPHQLQVVAQQALQQGAFAANMPPGAILGGHGHTPDIAGKREDLLPRLTNLAQMLQAFGRRKGLLRGNPAARVAPLILGLQGCQPLA